MKAGIRLKTMQRYCRKFRELPLKVIIYKAIRRIRLHFYYRHRRRNTGKTFLAVDKVWFLDFKTKSRCFFNQGLAKEYAAEMEGLGVKEEILRDAGSILEHAFRLFGTQYVRLPRQIPWNRDFRSGYTWENGFYKDIAIIDLSNDADVKVPWEVSRFQHVFTLGKAYWLTGDERYAIEFKDQVEDWIDKNPIESSVNWTCTMDVAIRAVNLITGYFFFCGSKALEDGFWPAFNKSLYLHGRFIYRNLEDSEEYKNNHYLSDIAGLVWLGTYFLGFSVRDGFRRNGPEKWLQFGLKELKRETLIQVNEDGTDYEAATAYHRLVTEILLYTTLMCERNAVYFDVNYMNRLREMCVFIKDIVKPNGLCPLIGDMDDGRFIITSRYYSWERRDFRHILAVAGELFNSGEFRNCGTGFEEDALFARRDIPGKSENPGIKAFQYRNGGYYIFRSEAVYLIVRCGELSCRGAGNHSHNDQLSFELNFEGEDFLIDPGVYTYTSDYRMKKLFRSTGWHNTLCAGDYEQNDFNDSEIFDLKEQTFARCTGMGTYFFEGLHHGYQKKCGIIHKRRICVGCDEINIYDSIIHTGESGTDRVKTRNVFNLDRDVEAEAEGNCVKLTKNGKQLLLCFEDDSIELADGLVSYGYGEIGKSTRIIASNGHKQEVRTRIRLLRPAKSTVQEVENEPDVVKECIQQSQEACKEPV